MLIVAHDVEGLCTERVIEDAPIHTIEHTGIITSADIVTGIYTAGLQLDETGRRISDEPDGQVGVRRCDGSVPGRPRPTHQK